MSFLFDKFFNSQRICGLINLLLLNFYALLRAVLNKATHAARQSVLLYIAKYDKFYPKSAWEFVCRSAFSSRFPTPVKTGWKVIFYTVKRKEQSPPFVKGRLGGIYLKIHPNPPLKKEGTVSSSFKRKESTSPPFVKGRLGGIYSKIHPNPPLDRKMIKWW